MNAKLYFVALCSLLTAAFTSCSYDNYDEPACVFSGRIVYKGEPVMVGYYDVYFQLWEAGWELKKQINVNVAIDGSFSQTLFNGSYKLVLPQGQGPYMAIPDPVTGSDSISLEIKGNKTMDIEVLPYYMVRHPEITYSKADNMVKATCGVEKIITDVNAKDIEIVRLYIGKTLFTGNRTYTAYQSLNMGLITDMDNIQFSGVKVPEMSPMQDYVFARIGVKTKNVEDWLLSPVQRIELK